MDWGNFAIQLLGFVGGGGLVSLFLLKSTKNKAKTEANSVANKEQSERIDLGEKYINQSLGMMEKLQSAFDSMQKQNATDIADRKEAWGNVDKKITEVHEDLKGVKSEVTSIVAYLNGGYQSFKDDHKENHVG
jgi:hypothetical protein